MDAYIQCDYLRRAAMHGKAKACAVAYVCISVRQPPLYAHVPCMRPRRLHADRGMPAHAHELYAVCLCLVLCVLRFARVCACMYRASCVSRLVSFGVLVHMRALHILLSTRVSARMLACLLAWPHACATSRASMLGVSTCARCVCTRAARTHSHLRWPASVCAHFCMVGRTRASACVCACMWLYCALCACVCILLRMRCACGTSACLRRG